MGRKGKLRLSSEAIELVSNRFKVLGEPLRLRIINLLEDGEMSVGALTTAIGSTQPNVSKHLKILQDAGLVARRQEGNTAFYAIADPTVYDLCEVVCTSLHDRLTEQAGIMRAQVGSSRSR
jgi:DNA-binding transcriptional ArsR family regulator